MRPELDAAGRERHGRPTVLLFVHAPFLVEMIAPSGAGVAALVLSLGTGIVTAAWIATGVRLGPPGPSSPGRRVSDRA